MRKGRAKIVQAPRIFKQAVPFFFGQKAQAAKLNLEVFALGLLCSTSGKGCLFSLGRTIKSGCLV